MRWVVGVTVAATALAIAGVKSAESSSPPPQVRAVGTLIEERAATINSRHVLQTVAVADSGAVWSFEAPFRAPHRVFGLRARFVGHLDGAALVPDRYAVTGLAVQRIRLRRAAVYRLFTRTSTVALGVDPYPDRDGLGELIRVHYPSELARTITELAHAAAPVYRDIVLEESPAGIAIHSILAATPRRTAAVKAAALAALRSRGYRSDATTWRPSDSLNVLIGVAAGSADGYNQKAFFFVGSRFLGTDTSAPSSSIRMVARTRTVITLQYALYRPGDAQCCPSSSANVRYRWTGLHLVPLDPIPTDDPNAPLHR